MIDSKHMKKKEGNDIFGSGCNIRKKTNKRKEKLTKLGQRKRLLEKENCDHTLLDNFSFSNSDTIVSDGTAAQSIRVQRKKDSFNPGYLSV